MIQFSKMENKNVQIREKMCGYDQMMISFSLNSMEKNEILIHLLNRPVNEPENSDCSNGNGNIYLYSVFMHLLSFVHVLSMAYNENVHEDSLPMMTSNGLRTIYCPPIIY